MKKALKTVAVVLFMVVLIGGYYYYLSHREVREADDAVEVTELDEVLMKQLDNAYPPTPREVVKFYNRIIECAYGDGYSYAQFEQLISQARKLMDEELLENNPLDTYKKQLQEEVASFTEHAQQIIQTGVCNSDEVEYAKIDGKKCAYVKATYFIKEGQGKFERTHESYLLRQDSQGAWKILAYHLTSGEET